jgi:phospholipid/cholesterol/gamma-HCH transport system permease protein
VSAEPAQESVRDAGGADASASRGFLAETGSSVLDTVSVSGEGLLLLGRAARHLTGALHKSEEIITQMMVCGVHSLPVAMLVAAFSGMAIALQLGIELSTWDQEQRIGSVVAASMCRELGPVCVGVILAARVGSAMAAELGTMRVSEEIDALEVMSIDPARFLVMPRVVALTVMAPVLTAFADVIGILGGAIVGQYQFGVTYREYFDRAVGTLTRLDIFSGLLLKAPIFGLTIAVVGCTLGLGVRQSEGAEGVGKATRNSVVVALILLIVFNYFLTSFVRYLK